MAAALGQDAGAAGTTLRVVLAALSDRLTPEEATDLAAQLPQPWKDVVAKPRRDGVQKMDRAQFVGRIARDLSCDLRTAIRSARAVFRALEHHVSRGEMRDVLAQLPQKLRAVLESPPGVEPHFEG